MMLHEWLIVHWRRYMYKKCMRNVWVCVWTGTCLWLRRIRKHRETNPDRSWTSWTKNQLETCIRDATSSESEQERSITLIYLLIQTVCVYVFLKETQRSSRKGPDQAECNVKSNVPVVFKEPAEPLRRSVNLVLVRCLAFLILFFRVTRHDWRFDILHVSSHVQ